VKELRKFIHEGEEEDLYSIALRDHQDRFFIDSILGHNNRLHSRRDLKFKSIGQDTERMKTRGCLTRN